MNKRIFALVISLVMVLAMLAMPATVAASSPVTYDGERIVVQTNVDAPVGTYVTIVVGKPGTTLNDVKNAATGAALTSVAEYIGVYPVTSGDPNVNATIELRENLATGNCEVYLAAVNTEFYKLDDFDNLSRLDINTMVSNFNATPAESYSTLFTDSNKAYLQAFNADVAGYNALVTQVSNFYTNLAAKKPFVATQSKTAVGVLADCFNEVLAFAKLSEATATADVISILSNPSYNNKYWTLALGEGTPYYNLGNEQKTRIQTKLGEGTYYSATALEADFATQLAISVFLECETETDLLAAKQTYGSIYQLDPTLLEDARLNEYYITLIHNKMIDEKSSVSDVTTLQNLYESCVTSIIAGIPVDDDDDDDGYYGGGGLGGGGGSILKPDDKKPEVKPLTGIFSDVSENHWAYANIKKLYDRGIVNGKSATTFAPNDNVTREEYAKMMILALGNSLSDEPVSYKDAVKNGWYVPYIAAAERDGLMNGLGDGVFGVGMALSREDAAVMIDRALVSKNIVLDEGDLAFSDSDKIAGYAKTAVSRLVKAGLITGYGDNSFMPDQTITRSEVCTLIVRMINMLEGGGR